MRTRTLLLLAVGCGVAILVAGMFLLLKLDHQTSATPLAVGQQGTAGDAAITVDKVETIDGRLLVQVSVGGVDDPAGAKGFSLIAPNRRIAMGTAPDPSTACGAFTKAVRQCTLAFPTAGLEGTVRQLVFERATEKVRWNLVP